MKVLRIWMPALMGIFLVISAEAQQQLSLSVDQAVALGVQNSKALHSSLMKVDFADAKASEVSASRLPSLKFQGGYTRFSEVPPFTFTLPIPVPPGVSNSFTLSPTVTNNFSMRASLRQPLFTGFRLDASKDVADYTAEASGQDYVRDRSDLIYNVRNAYWSYYKAREFKKVIDDNVEQIKAHLRDVENQMDQGMATKNDVLKVRVQLSDARFRQIDAGNSVRLSMIGLSNTLGISLSTEITLLTDIDFQPKTYPDLNALIAHAIENRPDVKSMEYRVKAGEAGVTAARSGWFPQIYLTGNLYYERPNSRIFPTLDLFKETWDLGVSVSLDIWNWGTTVHQTDQAQSQLAQSRDAAGQLQDAITLEITQTYLNLTQARERISVAHMTVEQAEENFRITGQRFKEGLALNTDMLDAEFALLQAKLNHTQALVDYQLAEARLEKAVGGYDQPRRQ